MILGNISKQNHQPVVVLIGGEVTESLWLQDLCTTLFSCCHAVKLTSWIVNLWEFERFLGESPCEHGSNKGPYTNHIMSCPLTFQFLTITPRSTLVSIPRKSTQASFFIINHPHLSKRSDVNPNMFFLLDIQWTICSSRFTPSILSIVQKSGDHHLECMKPSIKMVDKLFQPQIFEPSTVAPCFWAHQTKWLLPRRYSTRCQGLKRTSCHVMSAWWVWKWLAPVSPPRRCYQYGVVSAHCSEHTDILWIWIWHIIHNQI